MGKTCIGCGKAVGGMFGAFSNKVLYGDICITCTRKLSMIPGYQTLTPGQINSVVRGNVKPSEVMPAISYAHFGEAHAKKAPAKEQTPIEEVQRWKGLLDEGALSQEEFDAVKRLLLNTEEIRQHKKLLDEGMISQEEFDAVKRLLLSSRV